MTTQQFVRSFSRIALSASVPPPTFPRATAAARTDPTHFLRRRRRSTRVEVTCADIHGRQCGTRASESARKFAVHLIKRGLVPVRPVSWSSQIISRRSRHRNASSLELGKHFIFGVHTTRAGPSTKLSLRHPIGHRVLNRMGEWASLGRKRAGQKAEREGTKRPNGRAGNVGKKYAAAPQSSNDRSSLARSILVRLSELVPRSSTTTRAAAAAGGLRQISKDKEMK